MSTKLYDLAVKTGEYTDGQGQTKGRWLNVGAVMQGDDGGAFIMLHKTFNPAGVPELNGRVSDSTLISCFKPQQGGGQQQQPQQQAQRQPQQPMDNDPPF